MSNSEMSNFENTSPLRGALIGFGNVALHVHLPLFRDSDHFEIGAVVEPNPERARLAGEQLPEARIYPDLGSLLAENDLDFVDICTPPCFHADLMLKACRSGLHVFCEKPLVTSFEDIHQIEQAANQSHRVIFTVNNWKYAPIWVKTIELIGENSIGTVRSVSLAVLRLPNSGGGATNWRRSIEVAGGGIMLDHGWHHLYLILSIIKEMPLSVSAKMECPETNGSGLEESVDLVLSTRNAQVKLHLTWLASHRQNYGTVTGDKGTLSINDDHLILHANGFAPTRYDFPEALSGGSHHLKWMKPVIENFRREVLDVNARGVNLREARSCAQIISLAYRSQREGSCPIQVRDTIL